MLIPKKHVNTLPKLARAAQDEFIPLIARCEKAYDLKSYAVGIRSGDMRFNGGSIEHVHVHLVVGDTDDPAHEAVRFKMSSRPNYGFFLL